MHQHYTIHDVIARDHVDLLRRDAQLARRAARARRTGLRPFRRSR